MSTIKGVVSVVKDNGPTKGKFGIQHRISICIEDAWYSGFFKKSAAHLGLAVGAFVTFSYSESGQYKNIDVKTFDVAEPAYPSEEEETPPKAKPAPVASGKPTPIDRNIARGQAVNNAVTLYVHGKVGSLRDGLRAAIELHAVAEHYFDTILKGVNVGTALKAPPNTGAAGNGSSAEASATPASAAESPGTAPATPARKAKKAPPKAPPPPPEPEPDAEDATDDDFSDEVPFE